MNNRNHKRAISIFLAIFFIASFGILFGMSIPLHMAVGGAAMILSTAHVFINRKMLSSIGKAHKSGKLNEKTKWQYRVDLLLILTWTVCIITGILIGFPAFIYSLAGINDLFLFFVIHLFSAMLSLILVIVHIFQHVSHIKAYFMKKK